MDVLMCDRVVLGARSADRNNAIRQAGEALVRSGCVAPEYVNGMIARERVQSTYLGSGIAIPHGELADLKYVYHTGISVLQLPEGVEWEPCERAYLVFGLASIDQAHTGVLANLVELLQTPEAIQPLICATDAKIIVERLTRGRSEMKWN